MVYSFFLPNSINIKYFILNLAILIEMKINSPNGAGCNWWSRVEELQQKRKLICYLVVINGEQLYYQMHYLKKNIFWACVIFCKYVNGDLPLAVIVFGWFKNEGLWQKMKNHPQKFLDPFKPSNPAISLANKIKSLALYTTLFWWTLKIMVPF